MRRRDVVAIIGGVAAGWPLAAQSRDEMRRLGVLMNRLSNDPEGQASAAALIQSLAALRWQEGHNLQIEWRWAGSDPTLFERYAVELVALGPDVLLAQGSPATTALRHQTRTIPIVFTIVVDPVGQGFVENLARPGGNTTGFSLYNPPMAGKWAQMLTHLLPPTKQMTVLFNPATAPYAAQILRNIEQIAPPLGLAVRPATVDNPSGIEPVMAEVAREPHSGLLVLLSTFTVVHRDAIIALAVRYGLPAVYPYRFFVTAGGLMSYGIDPTDQFRRSADYVDRILKGAKPANLPVQQPTKYELVINLKTAKALGIAIAPLLLSAADEVIE